MDKDQEELEITTQDLWYFNISTKQVNGWRVYQMKNMIDSTEKYSTCFSNLHLLTKADEYCTLAKSSLPDLVLNPLFTYYADPNQTFCGILKLSAASMADCPTTHSLVVEINRWKVIYTWLPRFERTGIHSMPKKSPPNITGDESNIWRHFA